jgi:hypothetical protein
MFWAGNSIYVALTELMLIPDWDKILFSKSASPVQELFPSLSIVLLGAATLSTSPVDNTTPLAKGKLVLVFVKYPMLLVETNVFQI